MGFRRAEKSIQKHFSWYGNSIEEEKEFVELADTGDNEGLTRVSLVNHSPESNHTSTTESNAIHSSQGSSKKRPPSGLNDHNDILESTLDKSDVNDIEVVEVETMETIC